MRSRCTAAVTLACGGSAEPHDFVLLFCNNRNLFSLSSGGRKFEIEMLAGPCSFLKALGENPSLPLSPFDGCQQSLPVLGVELHRSNVRLHLHLTIIPVYGVCVSTSPSPYMDAGHPNSL